MNDDLRERIEREAEKHALLNAVKHESDANVGAIMGPLMGENPDFREHGDEIPGVIGGVIGQVNDLSYDEKRERLEDLAPEELAEIEAEDEGDEHDLPSLPNAEEYDEIRMRCAPNPNGPWHIGHARMPAVIGTYRDRYDGWFCVRFDDTDPETKRPDLDAYDAILSDLDDYLGFEPDEIYRASDRLETYYEHARELIDLGGAYTCSCSGDEFSELKNSGEPCPHRDKDVETVRSEFEDMVAGEYESGEMVLRVKTDIEHKNPALRDWVAFRMIDTPHPREEASEYRCWPMLDFQSGVDDHLIGITHIIRGIDLQDSAKRQQFVYDYFGWEYPEVVHWGHVQVDAFDVKVSTSTISELIEDGELDGWDDPRAPTLKSLRRRGIRGQAIVDAMVELGTSTSDVDLAMSSVYANNRDLVDDETDRRFLVRDGVELPLGGSPPVEANPPLHPNHEERGVRDIPVGDAVLLESDDLPAREERIWLKGLGCFQYTRDTLQYTGEDIDVVREGDVDVIHWVPAAESVPVRLRTMTGDVSGQAEPEVGALESDELVQFERVGFARIDRHEEEETVAYYTHG
ncbi:glutamate--tRNA(Glu/Gln) ligase [Natrialba magadii ATCC 43099]|uniref:Glutamate--tRNA ligase n=1 Tax=Natrialba magadii (strain ATCC 43099 / DSM 3394 / CCM 3739 / CIP 104546 / IAM 13178 / JCM 8861 / NBRC 102185 / NCIMB 2190 / MS3) TaxID=547559 RepID=D3SXZ3_NATMM|nr:glutamate--tRNA ligase [Natrialba magadii]ADD04033.1 glutamate--tRNA(Glu/Gln) ligase [Natrialba magadii ATCC 43099]ELY33190.1 glutamyl-tRNA ligase [Natrialba magadii ATCC 43099]